jgi:prophage DNA circulation protein
MANPLIDNLRPASFRGIPFGVDASGFAGGRRTQVHEYPQRDKPYSQDLGRATRRVEFEAFVVGEDYLDQADRLLGALEEGGSGALMHPWLGSLTVNLLDYRVGFDRGLGLAKFSLSFVEAGELAFPSAADSTALLSRQAAANLEDASVNDFAEVFKTLGYISGVAEKALTVYGKALLFLSNPAFALSSAMGYSALPGNLTSLGALFGKTIDLGWNFASLLNLSGKVSNGSIAKNDRTLVPAVRGLTRMATDPALAPVPVGTGSASRVQIAINQNAIHANARQLLLVQACGLCSYLQCTVYDDVSAAKNELAAALDAETLLTNSDDVYQSLMAARSATWKDLTARSRDSARLQTITPTDVLPMLAVAYDYYADAARDLEIIDRNRIMHPGFVPVAGLLVLSR